jgi:hypothetical protein
VTPLVKSKIRTETYKAYFTKVTCSLYARYLYVFSWLPGLLTTIRSWHQYRTSLEKNNHGPVPSANACCTNNKNALTILTCLRTGTKTTEKRYGSVPCKLPFNNWWWRYLHHVASNLFMTDNRSSHKIVHIVAEFTYSEPVSNCVQIVYKSNMVIDSK